MTKISKNDKNIIGTKIKELRLLKGLTQEQLSEKIGIDSKKLSRIETGRSMPSLSILKELSKELKFDLYGLMETTKETKIEIPDNYFVQSINILKSAKNKQEKACYLEALKHTQKCIKINTDEA